MPSVPVVWRCRRPACRLALARLVGWVVLASPVGCGYVEDRGWFVCPACGATFSAVVRYYRPPARRRL
jgi:hypothetical protein